MVSKTLHLPLALIEKVDRYAEVRGVSRNVAFEELLTVATDGPQSLPFPVEMLRIALKAAGLKNPD